MVLYTLNTNDPSLSQKDIRIILKPNLESEALLLGKVNPTRIQ